MSDCINQNLGLQNQFLLWREHQQHCMGFNLKQAGLLLQTSRTLQTYRSKGDFCPNDNTQQCNDYKLWAEMRAALQYTEGWEEKPGYIKLSPEPRCSMKCVDLCCSGAAPQHSPPSQHMWRDGCRSVPLAAPSESPAVTTPPGSAESHPGGDWRERNSPGHNTSYFSLVILLPCRQWISDKMSQWTNNRRKQWIPSRFVYEEEDSP